MRKWRFYQNWISANHDLIEGPKCADSIKGIRFARLLLRGNFPRQAQEVWFDGEGSLQFPFQLQLYIFFLPLSSSKAYFQPQTIRPGRTISEDQGDLRICDGNYIRRSFDPEMAVNWHSWCAQAEITSKVLGNFKYFLLSLVPSVFFASLSHSLLT